MAEILKLSLKQEMEQQFSRHGLLEKGEASRIPWPPIFLFLPSLVISTAEIGVQRRCSSRQSRERAREGGISSTEISTCSSVEQLKIEIQVRPLDSFQSQEFERVELVERNKEMSGKKQGKKYGNKF